jgi:hypothetical protein
MQELATALNDITAHTGAPTLSVNTPAPGRQRSAPPVFPPQASSQAAHRVEDEVVLDESVENEKFQDALNGSKELMLKLDEDLGRSSLVGEPDSAIGRLRHRVQELSAFHCPATRTVGFVGDSGVGELSARWNIEYQVLIFILVMQAKAVF